MRPLLDKIIHYLAVIIGISYLYQGIVPKLFLYSFDVLQIFYSLHFNEQNSRAFAMLLGIAQALFGIALIKDSKQVIMHYLNISFAIISCLIVVLVFPTRLIDLFNPLTMYFTLVSLSILSIHLIRTSSKF